MTSLKDCNTFIAGMMQNKIYNETAGFLFYMWSFWGNFGGWGVLREVPLAQNQAVQSKPYLLYFCLSLLFSAFTDKRKGAKAMEALTCSCNTILSHSPVDP